MLTNDRTRTMLALILEHMVRGDSDVELVAQDDQFLGKLTDDPTSPDSLLNEYGPHGGSYGPISIFNQYSQYGSRYGPHSLRNPYCVAPPKLMLNGSALCVITANPGIDGIAPDDFIFVLKNKKLPDLTLPA